MPDDKEAIKSDATRPEGDVEIKPAPKSAGAEADAKPVEKKEPTTLEIVKAKREERQSRAKDAAADNGAPGTKPAGSEKSEAADEKADAKSDLAGKNEDEKSGVDEAKTLKLSDINLDDPGWFDRLTKEQQKALATENPWVVKLVNAGKAEAQRYIETAKKKADKITAKPVDDQKPQAATDKTEADVSEAIDLLYDKATRKEGLQRLLTNADSKELLKGIIIETLNEETGYDPTLKPLAEGIAIASSKYPQLKEDDFFAEVDEVLREDEETYEALMTEKNPRLIAAAIREASGQVVRSRAAKKPATIEEKKAEEPKKPVGVKSERRENLERNTQAAKEAAGVKAGTGSRPGVAAAEAGSTAELVRKIRESKGYQQLGK